MLPTYQDLIRQWSGLGPVLDVAAKFISHRGQQFSGKIAFAAGGKALIERAAQDVRRHAFIDRGL
jgi:hypothetical protein